MDKRVVKYVDPRIRLTSSVPTAVAFTGCNNIVYKKVSSQSSGKSSASFTLDMGSPSSGLCRNVRVATRGYFSLTCANAANTIQQGDIQAIVRPLGINQVISSMNLQVGGTGQIPSNQVNNIASALSMISLDERNATSTMSPSSTGYDITSTSTTSTSASLVDSYRGVSDNLGNFVFPSRSTHVGPYVVDPTNANVLRVYFELYDSLLLPPFDLCAQDDKRYLFGCLQYILNIQYGNWARLLAINLKSVARSGTVTYTDCTINNQELEFAIIQPTGDIADFTKRQIYDVPQITLYSTRVSSTLPSSTLSASTGHSISYSTLTVESQTFTVPVVPRKLIIWCSRQFSADAPFTAAAAAASPNDVFFPIQSLNIQFANKSGILSGCSQRQLYDLSLKGGLRVSYSEFIGEPQYASTSATLLGATEAPTFTYNGAPVVLNMRDIGVSDLVVPGSMAQYSIQIQAVVANQTATAQSDLYLYVMCVTDSELAIENNNATLSNTVITTDELIHAHTLSEVDADIVNQYLQGDGPLGGNFFDFIKKVAGKIASGVKSTVHSAMAAAPQILSTAQQLAPLAAMAAGAQESSRSAASRRRQLMGY